MAGKILLARTLCNPEFASDFREKGIEDLASIADVEYYDNDLEAEHASSVLGVIANSKWIHTEFYETASELRIIARWGVGFEKVNLDAATKHGVICTISPEHMNTVAEYTIAQWMATLKRVYSLNRMSHAGDFSFLRTYEAEGSALGLYGFGRIGQQVAKRAKPLLGETGRLLVFDIRPDIGEVAAEYGAESVESPEVLFRECDTVSLHVAGADPIVSDDLLNVMRPHASLINPSRGTLVDDEAVHRAIEAEKLYYYVVDDPVDGPRAIHKDHPRVICTNHNAGMTAESAVRLDRRTMGQVTEALQAKVPPHIINPEVLEHPRVRDFMKA